MSLEMWREGIVFVACGEGLYGDSRSVGGGR